MLKIVRFVTRHLVLSVLLALVAVALLLSAARLLTPTLLAAYADDIAALASARIGQTVTIGSVSARWRGVGPVLVLRDVTLWRTTGTTAALQLDELEVDFGAADMLTSGYLAPGRITVRGASLSIVRHTDGKLSVRGVERGEGDFAPLLLGPTRLRLLDARVAWFDESRQRPPFELEAADVLVRNDDDRHQLDAELLLDGRPVVLRADLTAARPGTPVDWHGEVYLRAEGLRLRRLLAGDLPDAYDVRSGTGDVELWADWSAGQVQSLIGHAGIRDLRLAGAGDAVFGLETAGGRFQWQRRDAGWRLDIADLVLGRPDRRRPAGRLSLEASAPGSTTESWHLHADHVDLEDLFAAARIRPPPGLLGELVAARPAGIVRGLDLRLRPRAGGAFAIGAEIRALSMRARGPLPMIDNFSGRVHATSNGGRLEIDARDAGLHLPRLFRWPFPVTHLAGRLHWQRVGGTWRIEADGIDAASRHISTRTRMRLDIGADDGPFLDLQTDFRDGLATYAPFYYPAGIMPAALVQWLDRSIIDGRIPWGSCIVRGPLRDFPFDRTRSGHFEVLFGLDHAFLDYREGWPPLEDLVADVRFHNNSLQIYNASARLYDSRLDRIEARVGTLRPTAPLQVRGEASGPLEDTIRLLRDTPLQNTFGPLVRGIRAGGDSRLALGFRLPLDQAADGVGLDGTLAFEKAALTIAALGIDLTDIEGPLGITREGVSARRLSARLAGNPVVASVTPAPTGTRIQASARLDTRSLKKAYPALAAAPLEGVSTWDLGLLLPPPSRIDASGAVIEASSDLEGTRVDLPFGLGKPAEGPRPLEARIALKQGGIRAVDLGFDSWRMEAAPGAAGWEVAVDGPAAVGRVLLPLPATQQPVRAAFDRLSLEIDAGALGEAMSARREPVSPAKVPEVDLAATEVFINGNPYGELTARTRRTATGIRMEEMRLHSPEGELLASGDWTSMESQQRTGLSVQLRTEDLGRTLRDLAVSQAVVDGKGRIEAAVNWQGSPTDMRRDTLTGRIAFRADAGRIDEAEPGVGRLFGLLNVGALQRRLRLDFSDLFQQGFAFERIEGEFTISDGVATTDNTRIVSPSADIRIEGRTNLVSTEMDQDIYVAPAISGAVALAGGIAGGPVVGAALLAAGKGIDKLATVRYRMTGPWNSPLVERAAAATAAPSKSGLPEIH